KRPGQSTDLAVRWNNLGIEYGVNVWTPRFQGLRAVSISARTPTDYAPTKFMRALLGTRRWPTSWRFATTCARIRIALPLTEASSDVLPSITVTISSGTCAERTIL